MTLTNIRSLACHEYGHTLGLNHVDGIGSCMET
ncbi:MAG: matrixin family metalloprotease [Acidimicrobiia bacterium]